MNTQQQNELNEVPESQELWFSGSVDEAFQLARDSNRYIFLYWGAVWCPPCNELKSQVFSHPNFPQLMKDLVLVTLDGDDPSAQIWGDRLKASGYPTILVLDADRNEYLRISGAVSFREFETVVQAAVGEGEDALELVKRAAAGKTEGQDWVRLAFLDWEQLPADRFPASLQWSALDTQAHSRPADLPASLHGTLLSHYILAAYRFRENQSVANEVAKRLKSGQLSSAWQELAADPEKSYGARQLLIYRMGTLVPWLSAPGDEELMIKPWLRAVESLSEDSRLTIDQRLWTSFPAVEAYRLRNLESAANNWPDSLTDQVSQAVKEADIAAESVFDRHAVVAGAASLLRRVARFDEARELLHKELQTTSTPWYYYSSLASLEEEAGFPQEALRYSHLARETAQGRATRIQWITNDLLLNIKLEAYRQPERVAALAREFYDAAFYLDDGFMGRNHLRSRRVAEGLKQLLGEASIKTVVKTYRPRCQNLQGENQKACLAHFKELG